MPINDYENHLNTTVTIAAERVSQADVEGALGWIAVAAAQVEPRRGADFADDAYWRTGAEVLYKPDVPIEQVLPLFDKIVPSTDLGNGLADLGKDLARNRDDVVSTQRGRAVLRYAATIFDTAYTKLVSEDAPLLDRYDTLLTDYIRVVGLLDDARDREGMAIVARLAAPHLLALAKERDGLDDIHQNFMDSELANLAQAIGLDDELGQAALRAVHNKDYSETVINMVIDDFAANLLAAGQLKTALTIFKQHNKLEPGDSFWRKLDDLLLIQARQLADDALEEAVLMFPEMHTGASSYMTFGPVVEVLSVLGKDEYLAQLFNALIAEQTDVTPLVHFAYQCGDLGRTELFESVVGQLDLTDARRRAVLLDYYKARNANDRSVR